MGEDLGDLWRKAEDYRRRMQEAHERRLREAAAELNLWLDAKAAEVVHLASAFQVANGDRTASLRSSDAALAGRGEDRRVYGATEADRLLG